MKESETTPSQLLDHISEIIKEREQKQLPTYYTISIEQYGKTTPLTEREEGYENFKKQVLRYMSDYTPDIITVQLFSGKSRKVKQAFQTFKVPVKKTNPTIVLGSIQTEEPTIQQLESSIPVGRYYDEKFELQMRIMRVELEKQSLTDRLLQLQERYEEKLKDQEKLTEEKTKNLLQQIEDLENEIEEFEREIAQNEKDKHNSFGNIALGSVSARAIENLAKSDLGTGILKGLLGQSGYDTLQGHLAGIEKEKEDTTNETGTPKARIISETKNDPRETALSYIQKVGESLPDTHLRIIYEIAGMAEKNKDNLMVLWKVIQQLQEQGAKTNDPPPDNDEETEEEELK